MVLLEFSMAPLTQGKSVSAYMARSPDIIDKSGLPYQLTPSIRPELRHVERLDSYLACEALQCLTCF
jgi:hypothetical protein